MLTGLEIKIGKFIKHLFELICKPSTSNISYFIFKKCIFQNKKFSGRVASIFVQISLVSGLIEETWIFVFAPHSIC